MGRILLAALAALAVCSTAGEVVSLAYLSWHLSPVASIQATAITAAILQSTLLVILSWFISAHGLVKLRELSQSYAGVAVGFGVLASLISFIAAVLTLVWIEASTSNMEEILPNRSEIVTFVSVILVIALPSQISFMFIHYAQSSYRRCGARLVGKKGNLAWSPVSYVKSIRYSQTLPRSSDSEDSSFGFKNTLPSLRKNLGQTTPTTLAFPQALHHASSRSRLLPGKENGLSFMSKTCSNHTQESFDAWDTSSVDVRNKQAVMEASTPVISRLYTMETIPGSPRVSLSQGNLRYIGPPQQCTPQRSRSHSPSALRRAEREQVLVSPPNELHIHPLFRSDSPTPPPIMSAGTRVDAAPDAGQILFPRLPAPSLPRSRSGSLPSMSRRFMMSRDDLDRETGNDAKVQDFPHERKMTPPVPEWVLNNRAPPISRRSTLQSATPRQ